MGTMLSECALDGTVIDNLQLILSIEKQLEREADGSDNVLFIAKLC